MSIFLGFCCIIICTASTHNGCVIDDPQNILVNCIRVNVLGKISCKPTCLRKR